jgi:hypothetical protein
MQDADPKSGLSQAQWQTNGQHDRDWITVSLFVTTALCAPVPCAFHTIEAAITRALMPKSTRPNVCTPNGHRADRVNREHIPSSLS